MSWRYQPVTFDEGSATVFRLCEIHVDDERKLLGWTDAAIIPTGEETIDDMTRDLCHMLVDAYCWKPVPYESLAVGMTFERLVTMQEREQIASMVEAMRPGFGN